MKIKLLATFVALTTLTYSQEETPKRNKQFGIGFNYDFAVAFDDGEDYVINPESVQSTSLVSMDFFLKIPLKNNFNIYPYGSFTISKGDLQVINNKGTFKPEGNNPERPFSSKPDKNKYSGDFYQYNLSDASVSQVNIGLLFTNNITKGFEVGAGIFYRIKNYSIQNYNAIDSYDYTGSRGNRFDYYKYNSTSVQKSNTTDISVNKFSLPVIVQYTFNLKSTFFGLSALTHVSNDPYFGLRASMGLNLR